ncbi:MAG: HDOD domain-containing protein [Oleiphilus sp.]
MKGLHGWMRVLEENEMALLSTLLNELDRVTGSDDSSGEQLAKIILKDAHLTADIIRVANSVTFNPNNVAVTTVSRAVINIGFEHIRSLCLSIKVLEAVLKDRSSPLLMSSLARSLHAASQAKALCSNMKPTQQEEVFVASLLSHLAELLVLGVNEAEVKMLGDELEAHSSKHEKDRTAEKYLGVSFSRLAKTLVKQWRMQGLILDVVTNGNPEEESKLSKAVRLGNEVSRVALLGWDSPEFNELIEEVAEFQEKQPEEVKKSLLKNADIAAETVMSFGKKALAEYVPTSRRQAKPLPNKDDSLRETQQADPVYQEQALSQLADMMSKDFNINSIFKVVLSGLNRGVGLERMSLAIYDKNHSKFIAKYVAGNGTESWKETFVIRFEKTSSGFLYQLFQRQQIVWVGGDQFKEMSNFVGSEFIAITGQKAFFIAPLQVDNKMIGFIYCDMGMSSQELKIEHFEGFHKFMQQLNMAFNILASKR